MNIMARPVPELCAMSVGEELEKPTPGPNQNEEEPIIVDVAKATLPAHAGRT